MLTVLLMLKLLWWQVKASHAATRMVSIQTGSLTVWVKARRCIVLTTAQHLCPPKSWPVESLALTIWTIGISCHLLSCVEVCTVHMNVLSEAGTHSLSLSHFVFLCLSACLPAHLPACLHVCLTMSVYLFCTLEGAVDHKFNKNCISMPVSVLLFLSHSHTHTLHTHTHTAHTHTAHTHTHTAHTHARTHTNTYTHTNTRTLARTHALYT